MSIFSVYGQSNPTKIEVSFGEEIQGANIPTLCKVIGYDDSGLYMLAIKNRGLFNEFSIAIYDKELKRFNFNNNGSKKIGYVKRKDRLFFEKAIYFGGKLFVLLSSQVDTKTGKKSIYIQEIDKKTLVPIGKLKKICEIVRSSKATHYNGFLVTKLSRDKTKLLIYYDLVFNLRTSRVHRFNLLVFDSNINKLWEKEVGIPVPERGYYFLRNIRIDNNGRAYVLGLIYQRKAGCYKKSGKPKYEYVVLSCNGSNDNTWKYFLKETDKFLSEMRIEVDYKNNLYCTGFYFFDGVMFAKGTFYLLIDGGTGRIKAKTYSKFPLKYLSSMAKGYFKQEGKKIGLRSCYIHETVFSDDGSDPTPPFDHP